jgi:hypothetical protein
MSLNPVYLIAFTSCNHDIIFGNKEYIADSVIRIWKKYTPQLKNCRCVQNIPHVGVKFFGFMYIFFKIYYLYFRKNPGNSSRLPGMYNAAEYSSIKSTSTSRSI